MASHLKLTAALFQVWGVLTTLIGVSTLVLGAGAVSLAASAERANAGGQIAAGLTAAAFLTLGVIGILWGAAHAGVGVMLRRRRQWSRHAAIALGTIDLFLLPYGTALGSYSLWVLLSEAGKNAFVRGVRL